MKALFWFVYCLSFITFLGGCFTQWIFGFGGAWACLMLIVFTACGLLLYGFPALQLHKK